MRSILTALTAAAFLAASAWANASAATCDRVCLLQLTNSYFASLTAHDPALLPLTKTAKFTVNGIQTAPRDGLWETAGPISYRLIAIDPINQSVAANAVLTDSGRPVILFARFHVHGNQLDQLETIIVRPGEGQISRPQSLTSPPLLYEAVVPEPLRESRAQLEAAPNAYFDAIGTSGTPAFKPAPLADDMIRVENGIQTTGIARNGAKPQTVNQQLRQGFGAPGQPHPSLVVSDRRFPVIDEEHGIVVAIGTMNLDLPPGMSDIPGIHAVSNPHRKQTLIEFFKISGGLVQQIEATMYDRDDPNHQGSGW